MPGYILHLLHGKMYLNYAAQHFSAQETERFRIGLLMPDSNKAARVKDDRSHFYNAAQNGKILQIPDLRAFPYCKQLHDPFVLGYAAHLYLDRCFFGEYFQQFVQFLDQNGQPTLESGQAVRALLKNTGQSIPIQELFSEDYLYGDYTMLNQYIIRRFEIEPVHCVPFVCPVSEVDPENLRIVLKALDSYLQESTGSIQLRVFTADSLVQAIERYAYGFSQWAEGVRMMCGNHHSLP